MKSDDTARRGLGRKTTATGLQENGTETVPFEASVRHLRWRERLEQHSEADYTFLKRWAETMGRKPFWRPLNALARQGHRFPQFTRASLTEAGRARRDLEISLDLVGARADRLMASENTGLSQSKLNDSSFAGWDAPDSGWARATGVKRAAKLERVKSARVEHPIHAGLDLWKASGATREERGYHAPAELITALALYVGGWTAGDLAASGDWSLRSATRWYVYELCQRLRDYWPRDWDPVLNRRVGKDRPRPSVKTKILSASRLCAATREALLLALHG